jgi:hypothetical protein
VQPLRQILAARKLNSYAAKVTTVVRFRSKIDSWLLIPLVIGIAGQVFALIVVMSDDASRSTKSIVAAILVLGVLLIVSVLLRTHYTVANGKVRVVSGPFAWTIPISEITDIVESRSAFSSPALSLDRLKITYSQNRRVLVSPADKKGFLKAIEKHAN